MIRDASRAKDLRSYLNEQVLRQVWNQLFLDSLSAQFGDDVYLAPAVLVAKVVQARPGGAYLEIAAQLLGHERVDDADYHLHFAHRGFDIHRRCEWRPALT